MISVVLNITCRCQEAVSEPNSLNISIFSALLLLKIVLLYIKIAKMFQICLFFSVNIFHVMFDEANQNSLGQLVKG